MKYIIVFTGLFLFFCSAQAQEASVIDTQDKASQEAAKSNANTSTDSTTNEQTIEEEPDQSSTVIETAEKSESAEPNFDVFRPSEDISEDLAVPFPVDI